MTLVAMGVPGAQASYVTFTGDTGGFVANSASAAYLVAAGAPMEFISFSTDKNGNPVPGALFSTQALAGTLFSNNVIFSSQVSSTFGGVSSLSIDQANGPTLNSEIGPAGNFNGVLTIDFLAAGLTVNSVGFGTVAMNNLSNQIRIFDDSNTLVLVVDTSGFTTFDFLGVVGNAGSRIGRIELDGAAFGIQDIQFGSSVPEPGSLGMLILGIGGLMRLRQRR